MMMMIGTSHMIRKVVQSENWKPEWGGCTTGSREVPGEMKPVIRDDDNNEL
jgi:hypothetical protein